MARHPPSPSRLQRRLACHQGLHDPAREPRNRLPRLSEVRHWQATRLRHSFRRFLEDPRRQPAAQFFLADVYGDHDFSRRDADIARVLPAMERVLPASLLETVADGIELGVVTQLFDLRMASLLQQIAPRGRALDAELYGRAYREAGAPRLRHHQILLIEAVGQGLRRAVRTPGVGTLLRLSRRPAHAAGLGELQEFLERGFHAFAALGDTAAFLREIADNEASIARRLFAGDPDPFREA